MLIVDNDELILKSCQRLLTQVDVVVATSVSAARTVLSSLRPDAVLSDYFLEDGTGHDVLQMARKHCPKAELILISGNAIGIPSSDLNIADEVITKASPAFTAMLSRINGLQR